MSGSVGSEEQWHDGETASVDAVWLFRAAKRAEAGVCIVCHAKQPSDVRWQHFEFELRHKVDGERQLFEFSACHDCKYLVRRALQRINGC